MNPTTRVTALVSVCLSLIFVAALTGCSDNDGGTTAPQIQREGSVVYLGDLDIAGTDELFANELDGSNQRKLSGTMVAGGSVTTYYLGSRVAYVVSPDGKKVAYTADQDVDDLFELYVADIEGNTLVKVSQLPVSWEAVITSYAWSHDSTRLAYRADQDADDVYELYTVRIDGSENKKVNGPLLEAEDVYSFSWSPNGDYLAYTSGYYPPEVSERIYEIYTVRPDGTENTKINDTLLEFQKALRPKWSPDGARLVYEVHQYSDGVSELYTVRPDGTENTKINILLQEGETVIAYEWSPVGTLLDYIVGLISNHAGKKLYTVAPDGTGNTLVSHPLDSKQIFFITQWSPDSHYLSYTTYYVDDPSYKSSYYQIELYVATPDGRVNLKVSDLPSYFYNYGTPFTYSWSPDSSLLAYVYSCVTTPCDLYTVKPDGSSRIMVSDGEVNVLTFYGARSDPSYNIWSPDSARIGYLLSNNTELYTVRTDGTENTKVSGVLVDGDGISYKFSWSPDGESLVYHARQDVADVSELYSVAPDGTDLQKINSPPVAGSTGIKSFTVVEGSESLE